jgi:hypothetical protein
LNPAADGIVLIAAAEMDGVIFDYAPIERFAWEDVSEDAFLGGNFVDSGVANVTRDAGYINQGVTPVELATNATLDLNAAAIFWELRDINGSFLFRVTEGTGASDSEVRLSSDVDIFNIDAVVNKFENGMTVDESGGSPIEIGLTPGLIATSAGNMSLRATVGELFFEDTNRSGSTWATNIKLSEDTAEWDAYEAKFGEASLMGAIVAASSSRTPPIFATVTADIAADADASGPAGDNNLAVNLGDLSVGTFTDDYSFFLNGYRLRPGANVGAGFDIYPGSSLAAGQVRFAEKLKASPNNSDVFMVEKWV